VRAGRAASEPPPLPRTHGGVDGIATGGRSAHDGDA